MLGALQVAQQAFGSFPVLLAGVGTVAREAADSEGDIRTGD